MSEVITFTSGKGGVGKTTTTANVGAGLSQLDKKVVLVDADIGLRNLDVVMGLENRILYTIADVLNGKCRLKQALIKDKRFPNLYVIPSAQARAGCQITPMRMKTFFQDLKEQFDYILVDCPAGIEQGFFNAISGIDRAIVVTTPQIASLHDADCVLQLLEHQKIPKIDVLLNGYDKKMVKRGHMLSDTDVEEVLERPLLGTIPKDNAVIISQNQGETIFNIHSNLKTDYEKICNAIIYGASDEKCPIKRTSVFPFFRREERKKVTV